MANLIRSIDVVDRDTAMILRRKTGAERLRIAWGMWRSARAKHREWSEGEVQREVARRLAHGTQIPYLVTGSTATVAYGDPRFEGATQLPTRPSFCKKESGCSP